MSVFCHVTVVVTTRPTWKCVILPLCRLFLCELIIDERKKGSGACQNSASHFVHFPIKILIYKNESSCFKKIINV